jgi:tRNA(Ile)-lysidine synthase
VDQFWSQAFLLEGEDYLAFDLSLLKASSVPLLRNILRRAVVRLIPNSRDLDFDAVERGVMFITSQYSVSARIDLFEGLQVFGIGETLYVAHQDAQLPMQAWPQLGSPLQISEDETLELGDGWMIRSKVITRDQFPDDYSSNHDPQIAWLDAGRMTFPLNIRSRREGDRFKPLGMASGSTKLSDIFINEKIPREVRSRWPLICQENILIWVPGYRSAHDYRVTEKTCKVLKLHIFKQP